MAILNAEERTRFLTLFQRSGLEAPSARAIGRRPEDVVQTRKAIPTFADDMEFARQLRCAAIEDEIHRRAIVGWEEPVFYRGEECGSIRRFSDQLLLALARKHDPAFRESVRVDQTHAGNVSLDVGLDALRRLTPEQQERLRAIVVEVEGKQLGEGQAAGS